MMESASPSGRTWLQRIVRSQPVRASVAAADRRKRRPLVLERLEDRCQPAALIGGASDATDAKNDAPAQDYWLSFRDSGEYSEVQIVRGGSASVTLPSDSLRNDYYYSYYGNGDGLGSTGGDFSGSGYFGEFFLGGDATTVSTGPANASGSVGGYLDPSDSVPHPDLPDSASTLFDETGPTYYGEFDRGNSSFAPPITPDARFKGGRDVLPAGSSHMAYGGGYTLGFSDADAAPLSAPTAPTEMLDANVEPEAIAEDAPEKAARPTAPLRAAAGVSQTFELSAAPEELRPVDVAEPEVAPVEAAAIAPQVGEVLEAATPLPPEAGQEDEALKPNAAETIAGLVWVESSDGRDDAADGTISAADQFWAAIGGDEQSLAQCGAPGASCFFERNEALIQKTSSAVAAVALAGLLHRGWKLRKRTSRALS